VPWFFKAFQARFALVVEVHRVMMFFRGCQDFLTTLAMLVSQHRIVMCGMQQKHMSQPDV
jgi:hypothetical protein